MMRTCELCTAWAQWRVMWPEKDKPISEWAKQLLCGSHKESLEKLPCATELTFTFIGAAVA